MIMMDRQSAHFKTTSNCNGYLALGTTEDTRVPPSTLNRGKSGRDLFQGSIPEFIWKNRGKSRKATVTTVGVQPRFEPNTSRRQVRNYITWANLLRATLNSWKETFCRRIWFVSWKYPVQTSVRQPVILSFSVVPRGHSWYGVVK
jgi:hypothetical protein